MLKPRREISKQEAIEILCQCHTGVLSMIDIDGKPYGVPINYFVNLSQNALYFHCSRSGRKYDALTQNPKVSFIAVSQAQIIPDRFITHYESAMVEGQASFIEDENEMRKILKQFCDRIVPGELEKRPSIIDVYIKAVSICKIDIIDISGKRNVDY